MKIGLIGAGKMGFTLGRHLTEFEKTHEDSGCHVMGYYSRNPESAKEAARFTDTNYYESMETLVRVCDTIFLTVPDGQIQTVADTIMSLSIPLDGKAMIHTSGALSSQVFSGMGNQVGGYSIHPIYAVNSKTDSYLHFQDCFITIEGQGEQTDQLVDLFQKLGHTVRQIRAENKAKYHAAAVFASNLVVGLYSMGADLLTQCGFDPADAEAALMPLFANNAENMTRVGTKEALTGPVARCDIGTVEKHLQVLDGDAGMVYRLLSKRLAVFAEKDSGMEVEYEQLKKILE